MDQALYRIVQESLTNVVRHAAGSDAEVVVDQGGDHVVVMISDHGPGAVDHQHEGSGIAGMRERARALGGTLQTFTRTGGGFVVRAELPLADGGRS